MANPTIVPETTGDYPRDFNQEFVVDRTEEVLVVDNARGFIVITGDTAYNAIHETLMRDATNDHRPSI